MNEQRNLPVGQRPASQQHFDSSLVPPVPQIRQLPTSTNNNQSHNFLQSSPSSSSQSGTSTPSPHPQHGQHQSHQSYIQSQQNYLDFSTQAPTSHVQSPYQSPQRYNQQTTTTSSQDFKSRPVDLIVVQQMQQQYEQQIRTLQVELQTMKQAMLCLSNNSCHTPTNKKCSSKSNNSQQIVDTYCEAISSPEFCCKNCSYKTKSHVSLIIHNTNHLVSQRYLHLPTTVFSAIMKPADEPTNVKQSNTYLYPCGECNGKYHVNDLYLHIYQHHTGENPFHCDECNLFFMHYEFLDDHQRTQHQIKNGGHSNSTSKNSKRSRHDLPNLNADLTYYSVIKCSRPFSSFITNNRSSQNISSNQQASSSSSTSVVMPGSPSSQPAFPCAMKRNRNSRTTSHVNAVSRMLPSSFQNLIQTSNNTLNDNNNESSSNNTFKCHYEDCFFTADSKERLDFHLYAHRNSRFKCPYCPYVSNVLNDIKRHVVKGQKHDGPMFTCPNCQHMQTNCDKTFKDHIRNVHFGKMIDDKLLQTYIEDLFRNNTPAPES